MALQGASEATTMVTKHPSNEAFSVYASLKKFHPTSSLHMHFPISFHNQPVHWDSLEILHSRVHLLEPDIMYYKVEMETLCEVSPVCM